MNQDKTIAELKNKTLTLIEKGDNEIVFTTASGERYMMLHEQDCCESVVIETINGDLNSLVGSPITVALENVKSGESPNGYDSVTLTDFVLGTESARVEISWRGESNGYYSESVYFMQID